ncbi:unnamed protein product [Amoebophrya sp. A120]|nr:unnamed protein product [Amoebophrya sp. A120]|eukprot:GSA120T00012441001.1
MVVPPNPTGAPPNYGGPTSSAYGAPLQQHSQYTLHQNSVPGTTASYNPLPPTGQQYAQYQVSPAASPPPGLSSYNPGHHNGPPMSGAAAFGYNPNPPLATGGAGPPYHGMNPNSSPQDTHYNPGAGGAGLPPHQNTASAFTQQTTNMYNNFSIGPAPGLPPPSFGVGGSGPPKLPPSLSANVGAQPFYPTQSGPSFYPSSYPGMQPSKPPQPSFDKDRVYEGVVKTFNVASGFGFIRQEELYMKFDRDVFFNRKIEGADKIEPGLPVQFQLTLNEKNQPQAVELKISEKVAKKKAPPADKVFSGVIRTFNANLGYGFITCAVLKDQYDRDVFVHKQQFEGLEVGDQVQFKVSVNAKGQPQAREVTQLKQKEEEAAVTPPDGRSKFTGRLRPFPQDAEYTFLDSEDAAKRFNQADVFVHRSHFQESEIESVSEGEFEFDIVLVRNRPQARNLVKLLDGTIASNKAAGNNTSGTSGTGQLPPLATGSEQVGGSAASTISLTSGGKLSGATTASAAAHQQLQSGSSTNASRTTSKTSSSSSSSLMTGTSSLATGYGSDVNVTGASGGMKLNAGGSGIGIASATGGPIPTAAAAAAQQLPTVINGVKVGTNPASSSTSSSRLPGAPGAAPGTAAGAGTALGGTAGNISIGGVASSSIPKHSMASPELLKMGNNFGNLASPDATSSSSTTASSANMKQNLRKESSATDVRAGNVGGSSSGQKLSTAVSQDAFSPVKVEL